MTDHNKLFNKVLSGYYDYIDDKNPNKIQIKELTEEEIKDIILNINKLTFWYEHDGWQHGGHIIKCMNYAYNDYLVTVKKFYPVDYFTSKSIYNEISVNSNKINLKSNLNPNYYLLVILFINDNFGID